MRKEPHRPEHQVANWTEDSEVDGFIQARLSCCEKLKLLRPSIESDFALDLLSRVNEVSIVNCTRTERAKACRYSCFKDSSFGSMLCVQVSA